MHVRQEAQGSFERHFTDEALQVGRLRAGEDDFAPHQICGQQGGVLDEVNDCLVSHFLDYIPDIALVERSAIIEEPYEFHFGVECCCIPKPLVRVWKGLAHRCTSPFFVCRTSPESLARRFRPRTM